MFLSKKKALLQSLWSVEIVPDDGGVGVPVGVLRFEVQRFFGDFFESGRMVGGDAEHVYLGSYKIEDYRLTGELEIVPYAPAPAATAWGEAREPRFNITVILEPEQDRDVLVISAEPADIAAAALSLRLTRRARLD